MCVCVSWSDLVTLEILTFSPLQIPVVFPYLAIHSLKSDPGTDLQITFFSCLKCICFQVSLSPQKGPLRQPGNVYPPEARKLHFEYGASRLGGGGWCRQ